MHITTAIMLTSLILVLHHVDMRDLPLNIEPSIEQAAAVWLARYSSPNTRAAYSADLRAFLAWCGLRLMDVTPGELSEYRAERVSGGASRATIDRQFSALRAFYGAACELGLCRDNPFGQGRQGVVTTSDTATLTVAEVTLLRNASASDPRTDVLVQLMLGEGFRLAEVLALDHADVTGPRHAKRLRVVRHGEITNIELDRSASRGRGVQGAVARHELQPSGRPRPRTGTSKRLRISCSSRQFTPARWGTVARAPPRGGAKVARRQA